MLQAGSMLLLRKIHRDDAGPWLGAFGASFVSAGEGPGVSVLCDVVWCVVWPDKLPLV